jgi:hypothetical protein
MHQCIRTLVAALSAATAVGLTSCTNSTEPAADGPLGSPAPTSTSAAPPEPAVFTPVLGSVVADPVPVPATDGKDHLVYELKLTNVLGQDVTLTSVAVVAQNRTLLTLTGEQLGHRTRVLGNRAVPTTTLGPGQTALVWIDLALAPGADGSRPAIPTELTHTVALSISHPSPPLLNATTTESIAPTQVQTRKPVTIAPPLTGTNWLAGDGCCDMNAHRMAVNPLNGGLWAAERFAIDYVRLQPDGHLFTGDRADMTSYAYYGADIHAVADGPVVAAIDDQPDQVPGVLPSGLKLVEYGGNYVVQDIGGGNFAFYAHLKPGSVKVEPGARLTTGQVIGALGNSGNSSTPHLHFHVMSTPDPLSSDGLPFVLSRFRLSSRLAPTASLDEIEAGQPARIQTGFEPRNEIDVSPLVLDVMTYANP